FTPATTTFYTLSLHDALPISIIQDYLLTNDLYDFPDGQTALSNDAVQAAVAKMNTKTGEALYIQGALQTINIGYGGMANYWREADRKSTRLNSSHVSISYAVF